MSVSLAFPKENPGPETPAIRSRFETCLSMNDGTPAFPLTRVDPLFEDQCVSFGIHAPAPTIGTPTEWLNIAIRRLANSATELDLKHRPIHVPMPLSIFMDSSAADTAALAATESGFCTQEFMLEIQDASLADGDPAVFDVLDSFRRKGFRIGLDARRSAMTPFSDRIRSAIERLRISTEELKFNEMLQLRADIVNCIGGEVILDRANWRDTEELMRLGATHAMKLMSDA